MNLKHEGCGGQVELDPSYKGHRESNPVDPSRPIWWRGVRCNLCKERLGSICNVTEDKETLRDQTRPVV